MLPYALFSSIQLRLMGAALFSGHGAAFRCISVDAPHRGLRGVFDLDPRGCSGQQTSCGRRWCSGSVFSQVVLFGRGLRVGMPSPGYGCRNDAEASSSFGDCSDTSCVLAFDKLSFSDSATSEGCTEQTQKAGSRGLLCVVSVSSL